MARKTSQFILGLAIGGAAVWAIYGPIGRGNVQREGALAPGACSQDELRRTKERVVELESKLHLERPATTTSVLHGSSPGAPAKTAEESAVPASADPLSERDAAMRWRISAIEKFVPLSDDQKRRLSDKYEQEQGVETDKEQGSTESLDDILGEESARYYREQVQAAFKRVQDEEVEREVVWMARQLSLSSEQETALRGVLARVEQEVRGGRTHGGGGKSPQERMRVMIQENRRRAELRSEGLMQVLTPEQFQAYMQSEAESAASDIEIFHDSETK